MHRSGTSCLAGSLQEAGLFLGDCHTWNPHNLKGNRENQRIVDINDQVLAVNGAAWDRPPRRGVVWPQQHLQLARELFAEYAVEPSFGFKDPRTLLVLDGWKALFPHMRFIGIFRHPLAVVESLRQRGGMPRAQALELWYQYNRRLLREFRRAEFPLLCFDDSQEQFQQKLRDALAEMAFDGSSPDGEFYDSGLKTADENMAGKLPWKIRRLYRRLQKRAL